MSARAAWITASLFAFGACTPALQSGAPSPAPAPTQATAIPAPPPSPNTPTPRPADAATAPPAPATRADRVRESVLAGSSAFETVRSLTDEVGPRFAGSAGDRAAVAWAMRVLAAAGLERVRSEPVTVPRWVRGEEQAALVAPSPQPLSLAALGGSVGTPAGGIEAEVIEVASLAALASLDRAKVAGKIVYVDVRTPRARDGSGYGSAVTVRWEGATAVAKLGGVALLIRSIGTGNARLPHTGMMEYGAGVPKIPAAALATPDADLIHRLAAAGKPVRVRMRLALLPEFSSRPVGQDERRGQRKSGETGDSCAATRTSRAAPPSGANAS